MYNRRLFVLVAASPLLVGAAANAISITVLNPGFDLQANSNQGSSVQVTNWPSTIPELSSFNSSTLVANTAPNVVDMLRDAVMTQATSHAVAGGEAYTLNFYAGYRQDTSPLDTNLTAQLIASNSGDVLGTTTILAGTLPVGSMSSQTLTTAGIIVPSDAGSPLEIQFSALGGATGGYQVSIDSVSLSYVPEPATLALLAFGLPMLRRARRAF